jgi:UDP-glucose-4-epimerase GalE
MKILVAGGGGYIGSHTAAALLESGYDILTFDNFSTGYRELVPGGRIIEGDLMNPAELGRVFKEEKIGAVLHFASLIRVGESFSDPQKYYRQNLISSLNLMEAMLKAGVKKIIFSSSAAVYGIPQEIPIPESHSLKPANPYGMTKLIVEKILQDYERAYGLNYISLRYFNSAGADPDGRMGEWHKPETHLIPNILLHLLGQKPKLEVFGSDFPTPDGTAIRDYIHVTDLAAAHVLALEKLLEKDQSHVINLGTNKGFSVLEILRHTEIVTGKNADYAFKPRRRGDVPVLLAAKQKAESLLGWKLNYSDISTIISTAWDWHRNHKTP